MIASISADNLIKEFEDYSAVAYPCPAGHATIGWGHKLHDGPVTEIDKKLRWTPEYADAVLRCDVIVVEQALNDRVTVPVNQNQFDSLVSWTYNLGIGWLDKCSWLRKLNNGKYSEIPAQLLLFDNATVNGIKIKLPGLTKRRKAEAALFLKPYPEELVV